MLTTIAKTDPPRSFMDYSPITMVQINLLFSKYTYHLPFSQSASAFSNNITVLYGDNGSGKTTILSLIYHLLSAAGGKGHRTALARTPFQSVKVAFANTMAIEARRGNGRLIGEYQLILQTPDQTEYTIDVHTTYDERVTAHDESLQSYTDFLTYLEINPYYLTDTRDMLGDTLSNEDIEVLQAHFALSTLEDTYEPHSLATRAGRNQSLTKQQAQKLELLVALARAERWLTNQAYIDASSGITKSNNLNLGLLRHIVATRDAPPEYPPDSVLTLKEELESFRTRDAQYAQFGLNLDFPAGDYLEILTTLTPLPHDITTRTVITAIDQHVESIRAQFEARAALYATLTTFASAINDFFTDKYISFTAGPDGLTIVTGNGNILPPTALSSGERQLLLLLCNTLIARERSKLFIIDEPEISLNVKWQRNLLGVLAELSSLTDLQFLIATHSIEMITSQQQGLVRLIDLHEDH